MAQFTSERQGPSKPTSPGKWPRGKQWKAAPKFIPMGRAMETGFGQRNRVQDRNHSRSRSPHRAALVKNDFLMRSLGRPHRVRW